MNESAPDWTEDYNLDEAAECLLSTSIKGGKIMESEEYKDLWNRMVSVPNGNGDDVMYETPEEWFEATEKNRLSKHWFNLLESTRSQLKVDYEREIA